MIPLGRVVALPLTVACALSAASASSDQSGLTPDTGIHSPVLTFDWPEIEVGVGAYEDGPTGMTIIRFGGRIALTVDTRGGAPGTVNTDGLRLGYSTTHWDAIVFAGGSLYGEEAIAAVATGLKEEGLRSGTNVAGVAGAGIYDLGSRRLNEIYPDKALAWATLHALRPGVFPLGAQGAGRMAMQGSFFGCNAHSGQGGAFRQLGKVKIAAFVVVNASGAVTDRNGNLVSCHRAASWGNLSKVSELMANVPLSRADTWQPPDTTGEPATNNTTVSLIVTNERLDYADLQRLAIQVHTSMARAIQPFSTYGDGDTLFAASTEQVDRTGGRPIDLDTEASEIMWDAILASVPKQASFRPATQVSVPEDTLQRYIGMYEFGPYALLRVTEDEGRLMVLSLAHKVFAFGKAEVALVPDSETEFYAQGRYPTRIAFQMVDGKVTGAVLNPGLWQQTGFRLAAP